MADYNHYRHDATESRVGGKCAKLALSNIPLNLLLPFSPLLVSSDGQAQLVTRGKGAQGCPSCRSTSLGNELMKDEKEVENILNA